jgi:SAM-dependent methyltransferase
MSAHDAAYVGTELELFKDARNWKAYWSRHVAPFVGGRVLEVGAGIGANTGYLDNPRVTAIVRLEPDRGFAGALMDSARDATRPGLRVEDRAGILADLGASERFDTILYIDVLEHIEDDRGEVARASTHLPPGGHLVVLAPAFQWLYSPFDRALGHYRRYTIQMLRRLTPPPLTLVSSAYLDGPGALLSLGNRVLQRQATATPGQIRFWDRAVVPLATVTDVLTRRVFGRSVVCVWRAGA